MARYSSRMLTPPQAEEIYPYRRVWTSIALESGILFLVSLLIFGLFRFLDLVSLPASIAQVMNIALALLPLGLWGVFSLLRERAVPLPRARLLTVAIVSALIANAIGIPFIENVLQVDRWLPLAEFPVRIVGYIITVGTFQEVLKYLVVRYTVWNDLFRIRLDSVAYAFASAIGYATVLNLQFVFSTPTDPGAVALFVFDTMALHTAASIIVAYGLSELRFASPTPLLMPFMLILSSALYGILIPLRMNFVNARFTLSGGFTSPLIGLLLSVAVLVAITFIFVFLFQRAERTAAEAAGEDR